MQNTLAQPHVSPLAFLATPVLAIVGFFEAFGRARKAAALYEEFGSMTDDNLARHGLTRESLNLEILRIME
ncbi:MAG: hypothetical protein RJQ21_14010 [Rhodospirillales bacterium]